MPNGRGAYGHGGMYPPPLPRATEAMDTATMAVDTVGTLRRATEAAWEWAAPHMELLGSGPGRRLSSRTSSLAPMAGDSRTLLPALARMEVDTATAVAAVMMTSPSVVVVLPIEDLAVTTAWMVLGVGYEQRRYCARWSVDDASPQFPAASDIRHGDSLYGLPSADRGDATVRLEVVQVGD